MLESASSKSSSPPYSRHREAETDYATRPPQPILLPICTELNGKASDLLGFISDLKMGELSDETKRWFVGSLMSDGVTGGYTDEQLIRDPSVAFCSHHIPVIGWQLLKRFAKTDTNEGLFDAFVSLLFPHEGAFYDAMADALYFEPFFPPYWVDVRIQVLDNSELFGDYPLALFEAAAPRIMRYYHPLSLSPPS